MVELVSLNIAAMEISKSFLIKFLDKVKIFGTCDCCKHSEAAKALCVTTHVGIIYNFSTMLYNISIVAYDQNYSQQVS